MWADFKFEHLFPVLTVWHTFFIITQSRASCCGLNFVPMKRKNIDVAG